MTIEITLKDPHASRVLRQGGSEEVAISSLRNDGSHVHGELVIVIDGVPIPRTGYFGPHDVCVADWLRELTMAVRTLTSSDPAEYLYDECEEGQPAFLFERRGQVITVSVVDSIMGDGVGSPEWGRRTCAWGSLVAEVGRFASELERTLEAAAPGHGGAWVRSVLEGAG